MVQLTIRHPGGGTETIPQTTSWTRKRELGAMRRATIEVERALANQVSLTEKQDIIELGSIDTLRLTDIQQGDATVTLVCYSFEWDANRVSPTVGGDERSGSDDSLVTGLVNEVPSWSAGTINQFAPSVTFVFNHALRHEALRRIERNTTGEVQFRDEGTVDYLSQLGTDRSGSVELSPAAQTIEDSIEITNRGRELDATHVRVLGAHEGEAQYFANLVPSDDPATYENRVNYTTSRWSSGDTRDWERRENKDLAEQTTVDEEAASIADEITETNIEAKATVAGLGTPLELGDYVQVVKSEAGIDRKMRVHRIKTVVEGTTRTDEVLLSTRTSQRGDTLNDLRSIRQFNTGYQGNSVTVTGGPLRAATDASHPVTFNFRYPNIDYENRAELHVRGLQYRVDSQGAAGGGDHTHTVEVTHPSHSHSVSIPSHTHDLTLSDHDHQVVIAGHDHAFGVPSHEHDVTITVPDHTHILGNTGQVVGTGKTDGPDQSTYTGHQHIFEVTTTIDGETTETQTSTSGGSVSSTTNSGGSVNTTTGAGGGTTTTTESGGGTTETSSTSLGTTQNETSDASGTHTHPIDPGIFTTNDTPSGVDVSIGGSTVATNIGSGTFETVVDISDELATNSWNDITLTSDTLGLIQVSTYIEGYRKIGTQ